MLASRPTSALPGGKLQQARPTSALSLNGSYKQMARPRSAVPGWPGAPAKASNALLWKPSRPSSAAAVTGRSKTSLFSPSFSSTSNSGTRSSKDWQIARDLQSRSLRRDAMSLRRQAASTGNFQSMEAERPTEFPCRLARGPLGEELKDEIQVRPQSASWHKKKVRQMYKYLDPQQNGAVRLEQLRDSFEALSVPIDDETFGRYAKDLLPGSISDPKSSVRKGTFVEFHGKVWANQPAIVRWHAGDPAERLGSVDVDARTASVTSVLRRSSSAPMGVSASELRSNEVLLRKTFGRHADERSSLLSSDKIPAILQDLGLPGHLHEMVESDIDASTTIDGQELSFHQTVSIVNKCIATHEANREVAVFPSKVSERLGAALQYSSIEGAEDSSEEENGIKSMAQSALEAALFGDADDLTPRTRAKAALEAALFEDEEEDTPRLRAKHALEAALLGDMTSNDEESKLRAQEAIEAALFGDGFETPRTRAKHALEAALFGEHEDEDPKAAARHAIEAALLGDEADSPRSRAKHALECALLGDELDDVNEKAQHALDAAMDGWDVKARAREAIEEALLGEDESETIARAQQAIEAALFEEGAVEHEHELVIRRAQSALEAALAEDD